MVEWISPIVAMLAALAAGGCGYTTYRQRKTLKHIRDVATSILERNHELELENGTLAVENARLKHERIEPPNEYELAATYRSLGVEPPEHIREAEAQRTKLFDDIMADLDALGGE